MKAGRPKGLRRIGPRHYELVGVKCACGGQLCVEAVGHRGPHEWELYCHGCMDCDADGYATLHECVAAADDWKGA